MENFQGDLTDVVRAGSSVRHVATSNTIEIADSSWPASSDHLPLEFPSSSDGNNSFGDPFLNVGDPLLHELDLVVAVNPTINSNHDGNGNSNLVDSKIFEEDMKRQGNIFPRIKISGDFAEASPCNSPGLGVSSPVASINANIINTNSPKNCHQLQISSPRTIGLKRRKNQEKKVVCVPAPAAANSRTSGEVVPSDLWAWRKYGQKPIKGSPYPRGYYRCSSSKGCSARKQVERSRSDPNMLVISYTSEHNHPWPTQRNALAGSIRSNPTKTATNNTSNSPGGSHQNPKEESNSNILNASTVKEEMEDRINGQDGEENTDQLYLPDFQPSNDFFADLDELDGDSLSLLLTQGSDKHGDDPLSDFFNWPEDEKSNNNNKNDERVTQEDGTGAL